MDRQLPSEYLPSVIGLITKIINEAPSAGGPVYESQEDADHKVALANISRVMRIEPLIGPYEIGTSMKRSFDGKTKFLITINIFGHVTQSDFAGCEKEWDVNSFDLSPQMKMYAIKIWVDNVKNKIQDGSIRSRPFGEDGILKASAEEIVATEKYLAPFGEP